MKLPITPEQSKALLATLDSPSLTLGGKAGRDARGIYAQLTDDATTLTLTESEKKFLRHLDEKLQRPMELELVIGPFFDQIREG